MALSYDAAAGQFVFAKGSTVRRFSIEREATVENALLALELLNFIRGSEKAEDAGPRPDPLGYRKGATEMAVEEYLANGGGIKVSTYNPVRREHVSRLKPELLEVASADDLIAELGL